VAQWKRAGPITQRSVDRNYALLFFERWYISIFFYKNSIFKTIKTQSAPKNLLALMNFKRLKSFLFLSNANSYRFDLIFSVSFTIKILMTKKICMTFSVSYSFLIFQKILSRPLMMQAHKKWRQITFCDYGGLGRIEAKKKKDFTMDIFTHKIFLQVSNPRFSKCNIQISLIKPLIRAINHQ
jgi:hypothetical protein